jgi:hypothetical protein
VRAAEPMADGLHSLSSPSPHPCMGAFLSSRNFVEISHHSSLFHLIPLFDPK